MKDDRTPSETCFGVRSFFTSILFVGTVEGILPEAGLGMASDPLAQEITQDGAAEAHQHKGQHHHAAPRLCVAEQKKKAEDETNQADGQEKGKEFCWFHPCLPHRSGPGVAAKTRTREGKIGKEVSTKSIACGHFFVKE